MIAAALNYLGIEENGQFSRRFAERFKDFKVIRLKPCEEAKETQLQLCQPENYAQLMQQIQQVRDPSETFLELRGNRMKLQRAVRQMLFFDQEKRYEKILLEGSEGIKDFPWAVQIMLVKLPVKGERQYLKQLKKMDVVILFTSNEEAGQDFINSAKKVNPDILIFGETDLEAEVGQIKDSLEMVFTDYVQKRQRIKEILSEKFPEQTLSCEQARRLAGKMKIGSFLFGNVCDECGYTITRCGLGCF